eukprot:PhM_4_TR15455/c0_g1_i3/m.26201
MSAMEVASRFVALRDAGDDEAVMALLTDNATMGTVWGVMSGKESIRAFLKDDKRIRYLKKEFGPLKQKSETIVERDGVAYTTDRWWLWSHNKLRESFVFDPKSGKLVVVMTQIVTK